MADSLPPGSRWESAAGASRFRQAALSANHRDVLLIVVESLGHPADPAQQSVLMAPLNDPELNKRYGVRTGSTTYYVNAGCGDARGVQYARALSKSADGHRLVCPPELMAPRRYRTISLRSFGRKFFDREHWYPKIGFQCMIFAEDLTGSVKRSCGGPFRGPCDVDMIPTIASELRQTEMWSTCSRQSPPWPRVCCRPRSCWWATMCHRCGPNRDATGSRPARSAGCAHPARGVLALRYRATAKSMVLAEGIGEQGCYTPRSDEEEDREEVRSVHLVD